MAKKFAKLTRDEIRKLAVGESRSEHGIKAERLQNGDTRYTVNIMVDGERIHRTIGVASEGTTRTQAEDFIETARSDAKHGRLNLPPRRKTHLKFAEAADQYIERLEEEGGKNLRAKKQQLRQHLKPFFGSVPLHGLTEFRVKQYRNSRIKAGVTHGTVNRELATFKHLLSQGVKWKWIKAKPCLVPMEQESKGRIIALTDEQCEALRAAATQDQDPDILLFVEFALSTAMRHSEILRSRFEQVDFDNLRLDIPQAKAGARKQPITQALTDVLAHERTMRDDPDGWIFQTPKPNACKTGHRYQMRDQFRRVVNRAGLDAVTITPHVLRHTAITKLVQAGVDLPTIQNISGHKTLAMVLRYTHVHGAHIDAAMDVLNAPAPAAKSGTITPKLHKSRKR